MSARRVLDDARGRYGSARTVRAQREVQLALRNNYYISTAPQILFIYMAWPGHAGRRCGLAHMYTPALAVWRLHINGGAPAYAGKPTLGLGVGVTMGLFFLIK